MYLTVGGAEPGIGLEPGSLVMQEEFVAEFRVHLYGTSTTA